MIDLTLQQTLQKINVPQPMGYYDLRLGAH